MTDTQPADSHSPRVFISYSHDNREHCDRVLALAQQLRRDGIDVELDQYHQHELVYWARWCEEQLRAENSDFVLCVCSREYKQRIESKLRLSFRALNIDGIPKGASQRRLLTKLQSTKTRTRVR